jgi:hypothetical protein
MVERGGLLNKKYGARSEGAWLWACIFLVCLTTSLPYLLAYAHQGEAYRFSGFVFGVEDGNSYIAKMLSGSQGAWLFKTPYSNLEQSGVLMYLPYLILGKLAAPPETHLQLVALFHLFRLIACIAYILASYQFISWFIHDMHLRRLGVLLAALGGGLGWLFLWMLPYLPGQGLPLEFYSPETFGFLGIYGLPHLALARAWLLWALLTCFRWMDEPFESRRPWKYALQLGLFWLLAGIAQPLTFILIGFLIALYFSIWIVQQIKKNRSDLKEQDQHRPFGLFQLGPPWLQLRQWRQKLVVLGAAAILPVMFALYQLWMLLNDDFLQTWSLQNVILSPHPVYYLLAYGLFIPYAYWGWRWFRARNSIRADFLGAWILIFPALAYAPLNLQRRLPEGVWIAWIVLALAALSALQDVQDPVRKRTKRLAELGLWMAFPSTLLLLWAGFIAAGNPAAPLFLPVSQVQAFEQFNQLAQPGELVLCAYPTGNALPAYAPLRVMIGHGPESSKLSDLLPQVSAFYQSTTSLTEKHSLLCSQQVDYVFWGSEERSLGDWYPQEMSNLRKIFENPDIQIFKVEITCP